MNDMKLIMESWRGFINETAVNHTDSENRHMKTGQIEFDWGRYTGKNDTKLYYSLTGELGSIQKNGDPYTYDPAGDGKIKVISGPYDSIDAASKSIGSIINDPNASQYQDSEMTVSVEEEEIDFGTPTKKEDPTCDVAYSLNPSWTTSTIMKKVMDLQLEDYFKLTKSIPALKLSEIVNNYKTGRGSEWQIVEDDPSNGDIDGSRPAESFWGDPSAIDLSWGDKIEPAKKTVKWLYDNNFTMKYYTSNFVISVFEEAMNNSYIAKIVRQRWPFKSYPDNLIGATVTELLGLDKLEKFLDTGDTGTPISVELECDEKQAKWLVVQQLKNLS